MPPKKLKPNDASDYPCDHAVISSTTSDLPCDHAVKPSTTKDDPFSYPDVMTMSVTQLKSELNLQQVSIVGNSKKTALRAQVLQSYKDALPDKVAKHFLTYHDCHYRVSHQSKLKNCVSFRCTRYQVTPAAGVVKLPWTNYKSCKKFIDNDPTLDLKKHCQSCPGKMMVVITNGTVGLPSFPPPYHLCGNASNIPIIQLGQQDLRPTLQMICPTVLFKDVLTPGHRQDIINSLAKKVNWTPLTGGGKKRFYVSDLASQPDVCLVVQRVMKPLIDYVQGLYPSLVCVKLGALKSLPNCPSQYEGHNNRFHSDYSSHYPEIAPAARPVSVILALDPFEIQYLPHISLTRRDIVHLTVPAGHAIIFTDACLHAGGANNSTKTLFRLFGYMVSTTAHFPVNQVFKYDWNGANDDMDATISFVDEKTGEERDNENEGYMDSDSDNDGGGKQKSHSGM
jgi:hypothetical protein